MHINSTEDGTVLQGTAKERGHLLVKFREIFSTRNKHYKLQVNLQSMSQITADNASLSGHSPSSFFHLSYQRSLEEIKGAV